MAVYSDLLLGADVARYTTASGLRSAWEAKRAEAARALCNSDAIPVKTLVNLWRDGEIKPPGTMFNVPILEFIENAYQFAWTLRRGDKPIFEATGQSHAALKAGTCWRILSFLGDRQRSRRQHGNSPSVGLNELAAAISGSNGGKRYAQIRSLVQGLHTLGVVRIHQAGKPYKIALVRKRVKYMHGTIRRGDGDLLNST